MHSFIRSLFSFNNLSRKAFTLAEVLITLGIVGVVAAMVIPALVENSQDSEYKQSLKKAYSVLSQAYELIMAYNGGSFKNAIAGFSTSDDLKDLFKSELSYKTDCSSAAPVNTCFFDYTKVKALNGALISSTWGLNSGPGLVLSDGMMMIFRLDSNTCSGTAPTPYTTECGWITVDVNGLKQPNTWGKDIYIFFVFDDRIRPSIWFKDNWTPTDDCGVGTNYGQTCASKYLIND